MINVPAMEETVLNIFIAMGKENIDVVVVYMIYVPTLVEIDLV